MNSVDKMESGWNALGSKRLLLSLLCLLSLCLSAYGQNDVKLEDDLDQRIDRYLAPFLANHEFDGYVLVEQGGKIVISKSYSNESKNFTKNTPFLIGSITKTITAESIQILIEAGRITLKTPLHDFLPEIPSSDKMTIRDLLTHRAGVPDYYNIHEFKAIKNKPMSLKDFGKWISKQPLDFQPGKGNSYSNSGYNLLALIVESLSGKSYSDYVDNVVFNPLKMSQSGSLESGEPGGLPIGKEPASTADLLKEAQKIHPTWLTGSGSAYSSPSDLLKWATEVKNRLINNPKWKPYGWGIRQRGKELYLEQNGRIPGFASSLHIYPQSDLIVVALSSVESEAVNAVSKGIAEMAFGDEVLVPKIRTILNLSEKELRSYEGVYQITPNFFVTVAVKDGGLGIATGRGDNLSYAALDALGDHKFYFRVGNTTVDFKLGNDDKVSGLLWGGGGPFPIVKEKKEP